MKSIVSDKLWHARGFFKPDELQKVADLIYSGHQKQAKLSKILSNLQVLL